MLTMPSLYIPISIPISRSRPRPFGEKSFRYFIGYKDDHGKVMSLCIMLPKMSACRRDFDETKYTSFLIKYYELLEKCNKMLDKVNKII